MTSLGWILGLVGTLGIGGAVVLAVAAPALGMALLKGALALAQAVLDTRLGCFLVALAVGLAVGWTGGDYSGRFEQKAACQEAALRGELAAANADLNAARNALGWTMAEAEAIEERAHDRDKVLADIESELAKLPQADRCRLTEPGVSRLRRAGPD